MQKEYSNTLFEIDKSTKYRLTFAFKLNVVYYLSQSDFVHKFRNLYIATGNKGPDHAPYFLLWSLWRMYTFMMRTFGEQN